MTFGVNLGRKRPIKQTWAYEHICSKRMTYIVLPEWLYIIKKRWYRWPKNRRQKSLRRITSILYSLSRGRDWTYHDQWSAFHEKYSYRDMHCDVCETGPLLVVEIMFSLKLNSFSVGHEIEEGLLICRVRCCQKSWTFETFLHELQNCFIMFEFTNKPFK